MLCQQTVEHLDGRPGDLYACSGEERVELLGEPRVEWRPSGCPRRPAGSNAAPTSGSQNTSSRNCSPSTPRKHAAGRGRDLAQLDERRASLGGGIKARRAARSQPRAAASVSGTSSSTPTLDRIAAQRLRHGPASVSSTHQPHPSWRNVTGRSSAARCPRARRPPVGGSAPESAPASSATCIPAQSLPAPTTRACPSRSVGSGSCARARRGGRRTGTRAQPTGRRHRSRRSATFGRSRVTSSIVGLTVSRGSDGGVGGLRLGGARPSGRRRGLLGAERSAVRVRFPAPTVRSSRTPTNSSTQPIPTAIHQLGGSPRRRRCPQARGDGLTAGQDAEHRDSERHADLAGGGGDRGRDAGLRGRHPGHRRVGDRRVDQAHAEAEQQVRANSTRSEVDVVIRRQYERRGDQRDAADGERSG